MNPSTILTATVSTVAVVFSGTVTATAAAATVTVDKPCYSPGFQGGPAEKVGFTLGGFPAEAPVQLNGGIGGSDLGFVTTGADGGFLGQFPVPDLAKGRAVYGLRAATFDDTVAASTTFTVAAAGVSQTPAVARPTTKVSFKARGFVGGKSLYAHYAYTRSDVSHPLVKTVKLGALRGPCGDLDTKRAKLLPLATLKRRTVYEIQFDTSPKYVRQGGLQVTKTVFVP